jgi:DRG Family Regulatory Proteins, Tma46
MLTTLRFVSFAFHVDSLPFLPQPNYVPTLEDEIEMLRTKLVEDLKRQGKTGTPVTPETFAIWQEKKKKARAEAAAKKVEAELKKKKGGKGLSVLSGRDLYEYKRELFSKVDDEADSSDMVLPPRSSSDDADEEKDELAAAVEQVAEQIRSDLFLQDADDDLNDIDDD